MIRIGAHCAGSSLVGQTARAEGLRGEEEAFGEARRPGLIPSKAMSEYNVLEEKSADDCRGAVETGALV